MVRAKLKDKQINVRVHESMLVQVDKIAKQLGMGNSEYVRMLIMQDLEKRNIN